MIVCSCNRISDLDIARAVDDLMVEDPARVITPGQVYRAMGVRPRCGNCLSHAAELAHKRAACLRGCYRCACKHDHSTPSKTRVTAAVDDVRHQPST